MKKLEEKDKVAQITNIKFANCFLQTNLPHQYIVLYGMMHVYGATQVINIIFKRVKKVDSQDTHTCMCASCKCMFTYILCPFTFLAGPALQWVVGGVWLP